MSSDLERGPSFVHVLRRRAATKPDATFFRFLHTGEIDGPAIEVTWAEHEREARRIGARLQALGARGERVLLLFPPGPEFIGAFMGCLYAGAIAVPAFPPDPSRLARTLPRLQAIAADARARFALAPAAICRMGAALMVEGLDSLEWVESDTLPMGLEDEWEMPVLDREQLAFLQYTSGSTGTPRGVMISHGNLLHNSSLISSRFRTHDQMRAVFWLPVYHDMGLIGGLLGPMYSGSTVILMSPLDFLRRPLRWLEAITRAGAEVSGGPDFAYRLCVRKVQDEELATLDLSSWRVAFSGAEPVRSATLDAFAERFAVCGFDRRAFYPTYGLAEGTLMLSGASEGPRDPVYIDIDVDALERGRVQATREPEQGDQRSQRLVSCGPVDPTHTLAVVDPETRTPRADGEVGELWLSGPSVALGYWDDPEGTRERLQARLAGQSSDQNRFLRTGDLGFVHAGELYVTGRLKDLLILRGRNVYPQDIEELARAAHPRVRPGCAAAFGIEVDGEERVVLVTEIDERGESPDPEQIIAEIRARVGEGAEVELHAIALLGRGTIPKTSSGKIRRHACRAAWLAGTLEILASTRPPTPAPSLATPGERPNDLDAAITALRGLVAEELRRELSTVPIDVSLRALGVDSLRLVELTARVESLFGRALETLTLFSYPTIEALATFLMDGQTDQQTGEQTDKSDATRLRIGAIGPYVDLAAICADIERRSTRYQFDLERDVAWDQLDAPGAYLSDPWLREFGFDLDLLERRPEISNLVQWAMALQICALFEYFEFGVIYFVREEAERLGQTRSIELLALEEEKHVQLFRRYTHHLRTQQPELADDLASFVVAGIDETIQVGLWKNGRETDAQRHFMLWLKILFFEEFTVHLDKRLREAEGIQPAWASAHKAHRREEVQHIATDVRYLRAIDLDEAERYRISALFVERLIENFDAQFGLGVPQRLVEKLYPGTALMIDQPYRAERCLQALLRDRAFAHSWKAGPFFRELTQLPPEQVLAAAKAAAAPAQVEVEVQTPEHPDRAEVIAIVGLGCRFPGSANSPDALWELLLDGVDAITEIPRDRWDIDAYFDPDPTAPGKMYTRWGGFVDHIRDFDHAFFGISPKEARGMDPQQRMLLEVTWEALEHAGIPPSSLHGGTAGVFLGICSTDYSHRTLLEPIDAYSGTGTAFSVAAGRISYFLGLGGPCVAIDTACSSSLVAVHQACRALEGRETDLALVAGVNAILVPKSHLFFSALRAMSPVGRCKSFDASADGYVRSEGCGVVVLKRLADARRDGDRIFALIRGSAVNQDGRSNGLTAPNGLAQEAVMRSALARAGLSPSDIDYVEAHGTGTSLGDPIELQAIGAVHLGRTSPVGVGSLKSQIGHSEGAAGIAGLIKAAMIAERGLIPANLHFDRPTPRVPWAELPIEVVAEPRLLGGRRAIAVNSFGFGGTNAHVVIEPDPLPAGPRRPRVLVRPMHPILVSGHTPEALTENAARLAKALSGFDDEQLADVAHTLAVGRDHHALRFGVPVRDLEGARARLLELADSPPEVDRAENHSPPRVAFVFTGQGAQHPEMGRSLYETQPVYRGVIDELATYFDPLLDRPLRSLLFDADAPLTDTGLAQPALFCVELALASLWRSWGVEPELVLGHSVGEIAAACFAGLLSMADGAELVAARGSLMQALPRAGAMFAIAASEAAVVHAIANQRAAATDPGPSAVSIAAVNSPSQVVVSGERAAVTALARAMQAEGVDVRSLDVSHAFHSEQMRPMLTQFAVVASEMRFEAPSLPLISCLDPTLDPAALQRPQYWVDHVMAPVRFADGLEAAWTRGIDTLIEIGPRPTLLGLAAKQGSEASLSCTLLPSLRPARDDWEVLGESLCRLHCRGASIDWSAFDAPYSRRRVTLPTHAFQRVRAWTEEAPSLATGVAADHPLLGVRLDVAGRDTFETTLSTTRTPYLGDHRVVERIVVPATVWLELLRAGAREVTGSPTVALRSAEIRRALILEEGEHRRVQVVVETRADRLEIEVFSAGPGAEGRWVVHARASVDLSLDVHPDASDQADQANQVDLARYPEVLDITEVYAALESVGLDYGPRFRGLRAIRRGEAGVLAEIALPDGVSAWGVGLHPVLLDSALQAVSALSHTRDGSLSLPVKVGRYRLTPGRSSPTQILASVTRSGERIDLRLWDLDGRALAELSGLELRDADPSIFRKTRRSHDGDTAFALRWDSAPSGARAPDDAEVPGPWLVVGDDPLARAFAERLGEQVLRSRVDPESLARDETELELDGLKGVILFAPPVADPLQLGPVLAPALRLAQARGPDCALLLVTRGALNTDETAMEEMDESALGGAALWGLGRSIQQEVPGCRLIDLDPHTDSSDPAALEKLVTTLIREISLIREIRERHGDGEDQIALRGDRRLAARLTRAADGVLSIPEGPSWRLSQGQPGVLDSLNLVTCERPAPGPGEVEVTVEAAGLNFRDVLGALGMLPGPARPLGGELAGRITAVGEGVTSLEVGDPVMGMAQHAFARHVITDARLMIRRPPGLDAGAGATIPVTFLTAWYGLYELAGLREGESCLIHAAAGGVGMAAVQLAHRIGARVIGTASPGKWDAVRELGVATVLNSRVPGWAPEVRSASGGRGVDVVLNSLTGEFILDSYAALAEGGRFIEMGKAEIWDEARVREVHPSARYQAFDLLAVDPDQIQRMLQAVVAALVAGEIQPLPRRSFSIPEVVAGFRTMAQARHIGKIVLTTKTSEVELDPSGTWLVTGGFGGLGRRILQWLVEHGVRHLAVIARAELDDPRRAQIEALRAGGAQVRVVSADLSQPAEVEAAVAEIIEQMPPLRGVVHAAGVLDDAPLSGQTWPRFEAVLGPKAGAAWALHRATRDLPLDAFVLFSSIAGTLGSAGQANYAAANAFLDGLAQYRRSTGRSGVSIAWGPWAGEGMAAELDARQQRRLAEQGLQPIEPSLGLQWFARAIRSGTGQMIVAPLDIARIRRRLGGGPVPPLLSVLIPASDAAAGPSLTDALGRLDPEDRLDHLVAVLRERAARVMGASGAEAVDPRTPLRDLGLDSLMSVDLHTELSRLVGRRLDETLLLDHPTLERLATHLIELLKLDAGTDSEPPSPSPIPSSPASSPPAPSPSSPSPSSPSPAPAPSDDLPRSEAELELARELEALEGLL